MYKYRIIRTTFTQDWWLAVLSYVRYGIVSWDSVALDYLKQLLVSHYVSKPIPDTIILLSHGGHLWLFGQRHTCVPRLEQSRKVIFVYRHEFVVWSRCVLFSRIVSNAVHSFQHISRVIHTEICNRPVSSCAFHRCDGCKYRYVTTQKSRRRL